MKVGLRILFGLVFAYGAAALVLAGVLPQTLHATPMWYVQVIGAIVVGLGGFGATLNGLPQLHWPTPIVDKKTTSTIPLTPSKLEQLDNLYIYHLTARAKSYENQESLKLLRHLEKQFFCNHHDMVPDKSIKDEKTNPDSKPVANAS